MAAKHTLTDAKIRAFIAAGKDGKLSDGDGLVLILRKGVARWRLRLHLNGKETVRAVGKTHWPYTSLKNARALADQMRQTIRADDEHPTFAVLAQRYLESRGLRLADGTIARLKSRLANDILPVLGQKRADAITPADVRKVVNPIISRGARHIAHRAALDIRAILRRADLPDNLAGLIATLNEDKAKVTHRPAVITVPEIRQVWRAVCHNVPTLHACTRALLKFLVLTPCRPGEARKLLWSDVKEGGLIEFVQTKTGATQRLPLSSAAQAILEDIYKVTAGLPGPFYGLDGKPPGESAAGNGFNAVLAGTPLEGLHSAHGCRAAFRSIMSPYAARDVLEGCLGHSAGRGQVERAYMRATLDDERRAVLNQWADIVTGSR